MTAEDTAKTEAPDTTRIESLLVTHAKGRAADQATDLLRQAVKAVIHTGKPGSVTIKFDVKPVKGNETVVQIEDKVTANIPEEKRSSIWFTDDDSGLHRNDPNQRSMYDDDLHN